ncbi:Thyroid transcription factor 1-associated protein 26 like protein [Paragonimus heterotremus]|uniref:Thyroid transcription factor 1-associated protein 26 like protein n=1 Tax=Paragonimus heterotremus TaxID=100268 RepID=A0A8J4WIA3_9TREM|nr:Thyroid transcription factor 1-associated protein 26 like protein [Paragonimus heterotremus]
MSKSGKCGLQNTSKPTSDKRKSKKPASRKFQELLARQKLIEQERRERKQQIDEKRLERMKQRKTRNIAMYKKTKKGQPVMRHRIKLLLSELNKINS